MNIYIYIYTYIYLFLIFEGNKHVYFEQKYVTMLNQLWLNKLTEI
jgi:hypothetical protein